MKFKHASYLVALSCGVLSQVAQASVYAGTQDKQLYYDLQTLSEWGHVDLAINTYPVAWKGVAKALDQVNVSQLNGRAQQAYLRLNHYLAINRQRANRQYISVGGSTDEVRFKSLDDGVDDKQKWSFRQEFYAGRWSGQVTANRLSNGETNLDNSFIAYQFGDWHLRAGSIEQWWGPAQSSSLILSNNARPIKSLALSRSTNTASEHPWLSWLGPWYFTTQLGQLESDRAVPNTKVIMSRFNVRPFKGFEFGLSWSAMWGGEGQKESLEALWEVVTFEAICLIPEPQCTEQGMQTKRGNHLAGYDISYSFQLFSRPVTIYAQRIGEDAIDGYRITDNANLFGVSTYIRGVKVFAETSDTNVSCVSGTSTVTNCYYENMDYADGYRLYQRSIGSTFDSDAKQVTLGANFRFQNGAVAEVYLRNADLNPDASRPSPVLTVDSSEKIVELSGFYQTSYKKWLLKVGGAVAQREFVNVEDKTDTSAYFQLQYAF